MMESSLGYQMLQVAGIIRSDGHADDESGLRLSRLPGHLLEPSMGHGNPGGRSRQVVRKQLPGRTAFDLPVLGQRRPTVRPQPAQFRPLGQHGQSERLRRPPSLVSDPAPTADAPEGFVYIYLSNRTLLARGVQQGATRFQSVVA
ncbi:hypothetical protein GJ744_011106 [Endocarpon pusillum]|uniref:Uncharacterized protein n=1 Tax=Endocarpon pusillum TaxID=364733 RepID=A0A8H7AKW5_9EURO|nr:hypothetical protein GJ744_011106 [Endocarpon pusillum]